MGKSYMDSYLFQPDTIVPSTPSETITVTAAATASDHSVHFCPCLPQVSSIATRTCILYLAVRQLRGTP